MYAAGTATPPRAAISILYGLLRKCDGSACRLPYMVEMRALEGEQLQRMSSSALLVVKYSSGTWRYSRKNILVRPGSAGHVVLLDWEAAG